MVEVASELTTIEVNQKEENSVNEFDEPEEVTNEDNEQKRLPEKSAEKTEIEPEPKKRNVGFVTAEDCVEENDSRPKILRQATSGDPIKIQDADSVEKKLSNLTIDMAAMPEDCPAQDEDEFEEENTNRVQFSECSQKGQPKARVRQPTKFVKSSEPIEEDEEQEEDKSAQEAPKGNVTFENNEDIPPYMRPKNPSVMSEAIAPEEAEHKKYRVTKFVDKDETLPSGAKGCCIIS